MTAEFSEPTEDDYKLLAKRWVSIWSLAQEEYGVQIDQSLATVQILQRLANADLVNDEGVLALGVVFGRIMAKNIDGLDWWSVVDEFGRDLCLRYKNTTLRINPVSMVAKRLKSGGKVDFQQLYDAVLAQIVKVAITVD